MQKILKIYIRFAACYRHGAPRETFSCQMKRSTHRKLFQRARIYFNAHPFGEIFLIATWLKMCVKRLFIYSQTHPKGTRGSVLELERERASERGRSLSLSLSLAKPLLRERVHQQKGQKFCQWKSFPPGAGRELFLSRSLLRREKSRRQTSMQIIDRILCSFGDLKTRNERERHKTEWEEEEKYGAGETACIF